MSSVIARSTACRMYQIEDFNKIKRRRELERKVAQKKMKKKPKKRKKMKIRMKNKVMITKQLKKQQEQKRFPLMVVMNLIHW